MLSLICGIIKKITFRNCIGGCQRGGEQVGEGSKMAQTFIYKVSYEDVMYRIPNIFNSVTCLNIAENKSQYLSSQEKIFCNYVW